MTANVHRQLVVGLKLRDKFATLADAQQQFGSLVDELQKFLGSFGAQPAGFHVTRPHADVGWTAQVVLDIPNGTPAQVMAGDKPRYVEWWEPNTVLRLAGFNDPMWPASQWGLKRIGALDAWNTAVQTPVTVAIVDSGVMWHWDRVRNEVTRAHEDLDGRAPGDAFPPRLWRSAEQPQMDGQDDDNNGYIDDLNGARTVGKSYPGKLGDGEIGDEQGHGTMLAGIMFATPDNATGLASPLSPYWRNIRMMPVKFFDADTRPTPANARQAIEYAADNGAKVIVASWHIGPGPRGYNPIERAVKYAWSKGALVVCAAGNDGSNNDRYPTWPANFSGMFDNVLSVHATNRRDYKPAFSNYGRVSVHLGAPGVRIATTGRYIGRRPVYQSINGTSAACAFASLAAAMVLAVQTDRGRPLTPAEIIQHLVATADVVPQLHRCSSSGARLNLANAVNTPFGTAAQAPARPA